MSKEKWLPEDVVVDEDGDGTFCVLQTTGPLFPLARGESGKDCHHCSGVFRTLERLVDERIQKLYLVVNGHHRDIQWIDG